MSLMQHRLSTGSHVLQAHPPASVWSSPWTAGGSLLLHGPLLAAGAQLPCQGLHHVQQKNISSGGFFFSTDLGVCRAISPIYSQPSLPAAVVQIFLFSSLNHRGASSDRGNFGVFSQKSPMQPSTIKILPCKPNTVQNIIVKKRLNVLHPKYVVTMDKLVFCHFTSSGNLSCT